MLQEPNPEFSRNLRILDLSIVPIGNKVTYMPFFNYYPKITYISCSVFAQSILRVFPCIRTLNFHLYDIKLSCDVYNKSLNDNIRLEELKELHFSALKTCYLEVT